MKLLSYQLSDWVDVPTNSKDYCNYYRQHRVGSYFSIGLIIRSNTVPLGARRWRVDTCGLRDDRLVEMLFERFKETDWYTYDQLDYMKQQIDEFITRINNLAIFT